MSLRFRDLWAPAWWLTLTGQRLAMRPLSLGTFAYLEGEGITLPSLSGKASPQIWARLLILLADLEGEDADEERVFARLLKDPIALQKLQHEMVSSLKQRDKTLERQKVNRRQVKNPLEHKKTDKKADNRDEAEDEPEELDAAFVLMVARLSGLSLADISKMSFRGLLGLQEWLKENPPQPSGMGGIFG